MKAHLDFEGRSCTNLKTQGVYRYVEDPTTWPWGFQYAFEQVEGELGPVYEWRPGWPDPEYLLSYLAAGGTMVAHNATFERLFWNYVMRRAYPHWPELQISQMDCTLARAAATANPLGLDKLGEALRTNMRKDPEGHAVMMKQAKPRRVNEDGTVTWWDAPELTDRNMLYCAQDVRVEAEADTLLPPLSARNRADWELDQRINDRGFLIDIPFVERCAELVLYAKKQNDRVMRDLTDRAVGKCSQDAKIIAWLNDKRGIECTSLAKGHFEDVGFIADARGDSVASDVLKLRQASWKTSTAKYKKKLDCVCADGRIRGGIAWHGASTGRRAGRLTQPQNYPRVDPDDDFLQARIAYLHELCANPKLAIRDVYEYIVAVHGPLEPLELLSKALRSSIKAATGNKLVGGDFSNIEGRFNAWQANEHWKIRAFEAYDNKTGPDLYKLAYARSFGVDVEDVGKGPKRQIGKVQELALGYQGGVGAYIDMGATYGLNPYTLTQPVKDATDVEQWERTFDRSHRPHVNLYGLTNAAWTALQILVDNWRAANPAIVQSWWNLQDAAVEAVCNPHTVVYAEHTTRFQYYCDGRALWCVLPSGRMLCYNWPYVKSEPFTWYDKKTGEKREGTKRTVYFEALDSVTHQWRVHSLYGGLQCENVVQAGCVDILVDAMFAVESAGFPIVLTVHDEIVAEVAQHRADLNESFFGECMQQTASVYDGLPVSAKCWEADRYVK